MREALGDRGLADARFADQHGVVLGTAREDLHDALDLRLAADHGVELAAARGGGEVHAELVERRRARRLASAGAGRRGALRLRLSEDASGLAAHPLQVHAEALEHARRDALALADEAEQQVLGADVGVVEAARLVDGQLDHALGARGQADLATGGAIAAADDELDGGAHLVELHAEVGEHLGRHAVALADEAEQQVLSADVVVVEALRFLLGESEHTAGPFGEFVEPVRHPATPVVRH